MDIDKFLEKGLASKIIETELQRYINFFENAYKENSKEFLNKIVIPYINKISKIIK